MQRYSTTQKELEVCILMTANSSDGHLALQLFLSLFLISNSASRRLPNLRSLTPLSRLPEPRVEAKIFVDGSRLSLESWMLRLIAGGEVVVGYS